MESLGRLIRAAALFAAGVSFFALAVPAFAQTLRPVLPNPQQLPQKQALRPASVPLPDVTSLGGIRFGGTPGGPGGTQTGGVLVPFGASSALTPSEAEHGSSDNRCNFIVSYDLVNVGKAPLAAASLGAVVRAQGNVLGKQTGLPRATLAPGASEQVRFSALLPVGSYPIQLSIDEEKKALDANRANNVLGLDIDLQGNCVTAGKSM